jgi:hypothetical protein
VAVGKDHAVPLVMVEYCMLQPGGNTFDEKALYEQWKSKLEMSKLHPRLPSGRGQP